MNIEEISFKLKPMVKDLEWTNFKNYLASNDFDRLCINIGYGKLWDSLKSTIRAYYKSNGIYASDTSIAFEVFFNILNSNFGNCKNPYPLVEVSEFSSFLFAGFKGYFLSDYEVSEKFTKILEDLQYLPTTINQRKLLQEQYSIKLKILKESQAKRRAEDEQKVKEREQRRIQKLNQIIEVKPNTKKGKTSKKEYLPKTSNNNAVITLSEQRLNLILAISEAKYDEVIKKLTTFVIETNNPTWINSVVNISSRWHILQDQINKDTAIQSNISIELNKINQALLNFINEVINTGSTFSNKN
jgi:Effector-associated domain 11